ncbi:SpvB/TcaC N-terminal domain-containing protein [Methylomonas sp. MED-D]|uniref:SpvB/TcaC N-terminal domain-containing protein n=1 Tax=unclassified Methylomonas TaxID=2608980 RepID=UPI0028A39BFF|nr:SpvB/TcaC N-terminal domain-containing protein [Methylomonas sp. MV1]MDT4331860.1 SpvB/TcaC N-terminal domain-containing protein [Methylomonas sp. MV1]
MSNKSGTSSQIIGLPQGGGAIHGLGEKFSPDLHTGTGNFSVPIALPSGRNGFQPHLTLGYSTGSGNGPFGFGWALSVPGVMRKTSGGLPRYDDRSDTFLLSGAEDLVPVNEASGITRYRPRSEGLFARIVHRRDKVRDYWQVSSKDGLVSYYGSAATAAPELATIADPNDRQRIFAWKLSQTVDPFGNRIDYVYERDHQPEGATRRWDQLYLSELRYADYGDPANPHFLVRVRFVYADRPDPFSDYRAGFEVRTTRRCVRIEIYTQADQERLTRNYHLDYLDQLGDADLPANGASLLARIRVEGRDGQATEFLPPLTFDYSRFQPKAQTFFAVRGPLPAASLAHPEYELADLFGNGLPDIVQLNGTARYWRNLGDGRFAEPRPMADAPAGLNLGQAGVQLIDADGDGRIDLLVHRDNLSGYFPLRYDGLWDKSAFRRYTVAPSFNFQDPEVKLVDLTGDGVTDAIRSSNRLEVFFNDRNVGWQASRAVERQALERFPNVNFSDPRVKWGDFSGDGLQDIALIHDGNVSYWPNLGYGDWGARVAMAHSPRLPYGYDPKRILIDDIDGDGLADIVYVDDRKVLIWINQSGNRWSDPIEITGTPAVTDIDAIRLVDLLGSGHRGLLWSRDADGSGRPPMYFLDFCGGVKPYLLTQMDNHMGALTQVAYAPSTRFYLEDQAHPAYRWQTPLPMPVQVVAKVEVIDQISQGKLTSEYRYRHGYWDGAEREFRGFGRVDQLDSEVFADFHGSGLHGGRAFEAVGAEQFSPPLETRTWFHQGPVGDEFGDWRELDCRSEFWPGDTNALDRPAAVTAKLNSLPRRRKRDALRALRGSVLRTELYALDGSERENRPYTVTEHLQGVREEVPPPNDSGRPGIYFAYGLAERTSQWERGNEPLTQLAFTAEPDQYGRSTAALAIAVPRGRDYRSAASGPVSPYLATVSETVYAKRDDDRRYLIDRTVKISQYQVINDGKLSASMLWSAVQSGKAASQLFAQTLNFYDGPAFAGLPFGQLGDFGALTRTENLVFTDAQLKVLYGAADPIADPAPGDQSLAGIGKHAGAAEGMTHKASRRSAASLALLTIPPYLQPAGATWNDDYPAEFHTLPGLVGYVYRPSGAGAMSAPGYFVVTAAHAYDFQSDNASGKPRGLLLQQRDPLGRATTIAYDVYQLLPVRVLDPLGLMVEAEYDYRVLQAACVTDPNGNRSRARFTPLGLPRATLIQGKADAAEGDIDRPSIEMEYDLTAFGERGQPVSVRTRRYQYHDSDSDVPLPQRDETIDSVEYSDGFGRLLQTRVQSEEIRFGDATFGGGILPIDQADAAGTKLAFTGDRNAEADQPNVLVSGWQIYDNKGRVVEKYEPFYSRGWVYAAPGEAQLGQKAIMSYDPRGQVIRTLNPDGSEQRVIYGVPTDLAEPEQFAPTPWEAYTYDANDNAGRTHAATSQAFQSHWNTPASILIDALGRTVQATARNGASPADWYVTRSDYDIRGNLLSVTDALNRVAFRYDYDLLNRPWRTESIDAGLRRTVLDAIGNPLEQRDGKGALTLHGYDEGNRPNRLWARDGLNQTLTLREVSIYGDRPESGLSADAARRQNLLGKLVQHYDEAGLVSVPGYDFKGNPLSQSRQVLSDATLLSVYQNGAARNWAVDAYRIDWQAPAGTTLAAHAQTLLDANVYETTSSFDALNRVKRTQYPTDVTGQRQELLPLYNRAGGLAQVKLNGQLFVQQIAYSAKGQRVLVAYGNGVMSRYAYDPRTFRLSRLRTERYSQPEADRYQPNGEALQDFAYRYDLVGNILQIEDRAQGSGILNNPAAASVADNALKQLLASGDALLRQFAYDPIYRLLSATGRECDQAPETPPWLDQPRCTDLTRTRAYSQQYRYDALGNMLEMKHQLADGARNRVFTNAAGNNRLDTVTIGQGVYRYAYDANGNMLSEHQTRRFDWDHGDRLKAFRIQVAGSEPSVHAQYLYDAGGMRVKKLTRKQGGEYTVTVYIGGLFEYHRAVQGATVQENNTLHVMDDQSRIALVRVGTPFPDDTTPAIKYHLGDHLGSSHVVIGGDGVWLNREEYTPYGETSFGSFARKRYRFTGKERDEESGLNYHAARYYAAWVVRWLSADPLGLVSGPSLYQYSSSNPIINIDPRGTDEKSVVASATTNEYVPPVGAPDRKSLPETSPEVLGREDLDTIFQNNLTLRSRVETVSKELDIDPGLLGASLLAESGASTWSEKAGSVPSEILGMDDWFDPNLSKGLKAIITAHPALGIKFTDVKATGDTWDTSTEKAGGNSKPRGLLPSEKAVTAFGVYFKMQENMLRDKLSRDASSQTLDDLDPEKRFTVLRVALNAGIVPATKLFSRLAGGDDIPRSGKTTRDPRNATRTAVLHTARAIHLDQAIFGRSPSEYRPINSGISNSEAAAVFNLPYLKNLPNYIVPRHY